jgi:hypothetical protein
MHTLAGVHPDFGMREEIDWPNCFWITRAAVARGEIAADNGTSIADSLALHECFARRRSWPNSVVRFSEPRKQGQARCDLGDGF